MEKLVLLALSLLTVYGVKEKPMPDDFNAMDQIYTVNQINPNDDTFSVSIKQEIFEGDIVWTNKLKSEIGEMRVRAASGMVPFDAIKNGAWANGVVPYTFRRGFSYRTAVMQAIQEYNSKTCIRFKPYTAALARQAGGYVEFMHGGGCYSKIGRQGGRQDISLGYGCGYKGVAIHKMMHALGFFHEQSRLDRNNYVTVNFRNINTAMRYNFGKYLPGQASTLGEPYDKQSIMHYGNYAFSKNRRKTIVSRANPNERLGQRNGLSVIDVRQLKKYYKCGNVGPIKPTPSDCKNQYGFCVDFKSKWCSNSFVKVNCKKSCNLCPKTTCEDLATKRNCNYWRGLRYCTTGNWIQYMRTNCKKTCGHC